MNENRFLQRFWLFSDTRLNGIAQMKAVVAGLLSINYLGEGFLIQWIINSETI